MAKKTKAPKVSLETGVSEDALARLPLEALDKIDQLVVDADQTVVVSPVVFEDDLLGESKPKKLIGYHPITGAEVWQ